MTKPNLFTPKAGLEHPESENTEYKSNWNDENLKKMGLNERQIKAVMYVKEKARELGLFVDDRELLECHKCGLMEDVDINGKLLTVFEKEPNKDTGLRFKEIGNSATFRCPNCGNQISENFAKIMGRK